MEFLLPIYTFSLSAMFVYVVVRMEMEHKQERKELIDRLMSKDLVEYKQFNDHPKEEEKETPPERFVELDEKQWEEEVNG